MIDQGSKHNFKPKQFNNKITMFGGSIARADGIYRRKIIERNTYLLFRIE